MGDQRAKTASRDIDALFRLGVISGLSDGQLLERFTAQADREGQLAFEAIVRRHGPMVLGVCRRVLGHEQSAEDAFQATFMVLALKAPAVRQRESLGSWLHGVAARVARRALATRRGQQPHPLPEGDLIATAAPDPALADLATVIDEELGRLPDKYRLPVVLCYLEGRTQEEAARTLGWTKGTVSGRLARAKDLLRGRLARRGLAPSVGLVAMVLAPETASAAVPASLLVATVRIATAAVLGGAEAGLIAGSVSSLVRAAMTWMLVARLVKVTALSLVLGLAAAAVATPILSTGDPGHPGGAPAATAGSATGRANPDPRAPRLDRFGDPLPDRAQLRLGTVQRRHTRRVVGIDFARDGRLISVQADGLERFWDGQTGRPLRADSLVDDAPGENRAIRFFAVSPDGRLLAASGFDLDKPSPRGPRPVWIWELEPHRLLRRLDVETFDLYSLAFSPDSATLATGGFGGDVQFWDVATGARRSGFKIGGHSVHTLAFSPDGKTLAATAQGRDITLWDLEHGRGTLLPNLKGSAFPLRYSPDGRLLAVPEIATGTVLWDCSTGEQRVRVPGRVAAFAPDSRSMVTVAAGDGMLNLLDTHEGLVRWKADAGGGLTGSDPVFSPDGKSIAMETDGVLRFFDAASGRELSGSLETEPLKVSTVRYSPDGRQIVAAEFGGTVRLWDPATGRQIGVIRHRGRIDRIAVSPDGGSLATAGWQSHDAVSVWDLASWRLRQRWWAPGETEQVKALAFSTDSTAVLVYGDTRELKVFDIATGRERPAVQPRFELTQQPPLGLMMEEGAFSPGNQFLAVRAARVVHVADLATGEERLSRPCFAMAFSADGKSLAIATPARPVLQDYGNGKVPVSTLDSEAILLVDLESGADRRIEIPPDLVQALAVSPDATLLAVAASMRQPMIRLYRIQDGRQIEALTIPAAVSHHDALAFSPDGQSLAVGLDDTTIPIWDVSAFH